MCVQLLEIPGRNGAQCLADDFGELRRVPSGCHAQQLRKADVTDHGKPGKLGLAGQTAELRLIDDGVSRLLTEQELQSLTFQRHALQIEVSVIAAQVVSRGARHAHGNAHLAVELFQIHRAGAITFADDQLRHAHVRIGIQPQAQAGRRLGQARGEVDLPIGEGFFKLGLIGITAPQQLHPKGLCHEIDEVDVGAR